MTGDPDSLVGVLADSGRLHAAPVFDKHWEGLSLCGTVSPASTPERRRWNPDDPRACRRCVRIAAKR